MPTGVELQLFDGATPAANLSGIQALWWDVTEPKDASRPVGKSSVVTTDASGYIHLDLSNVTGLAPTDQGFLMLYKLDGTDHQDSPMFAGKVAVSTITSGVDMYYYDSGWTRPADWLALPEVLATDQKFVGLHAVYPENSNFVALSAEGDYTVDWGDGTTENFAAGVVAERNIDYTATALNGSECSRGYKQTIITVTPQAGQNLTKLDLHVKHSQTGLQTYSGGFLDIALASEHLIDLRLGVLNPGMTTQTIRFDWLEQINIVRSNMKQCEQLFRNCNRLQSIVDVATSTDAASTAAVTFTAATNVVNHTAHGRINGESVAFSEINTTTGIVVHTRYYITNATADTYQVASTYIGAALALTNDGTGTAVYGTSFGFMFSGCSSLESIPLLNTANGLFFSGTFQNCSSLESIPLLNTANGVLFNNLFQSCSALRSIPLLDTSNGANFTSAFNGCSSLQSIPLLDTSNATNFLLVFTSCFSLERGALSGTRYAISYASCKLSGAELNRIYENLGAPNGGAQTITVTNNWGTATDNPALVPAGWTVSGS